MSDTDGHGSTVAERRARERLIAAWRSDSIGPEAWNIDQQATADH